MVIYRLGMLKKYIFAADAVKTEQMSAENRAFCLDQGECRFL